MKIKIKANKKEKILETLRRKLKNKASPKNIPTTIKTIAENNSQL